MPKVRIGFSSDFVLDSSEVGIGTTNPTVTLDVYGVAKADFDITGVATLTSYGGFVSQKQNVSTASTIGFSTTGIGTVGITSFISVNERETGFISLVGEFNTLSEDLIVDDGKILDISTIRNIGVTTIGTQNVYVPTNTAVSLGTLESLNVTSHFSVPNGGINSRFPHAMEGMVRFNDDLNTLEFYNGVEWRQFTVDGSSGRGILGNGQGGTTLDFVQIQSLGNAQRFGDLSVSRGTLGSASNSIRGVFSGGALSPSSESNVIDYITLASEGNAIDFGDLTRTTKGIASGTCSSSTRGLFAGGYTSTPADDSTNVIDYIQIGTLGNALDFGDLSASSGTGVALLATCSSPTRGILAGGYVQPAIRTTEIHSITISSTGNTVSFGNLTQGRYAIGGCSNTTRGIFMGGFNPITNIIEYVTIASSGNATYFGDATQNSSLSAAVSTSTRGVFTCSNNNVINYITIASTGNAQDFGDLTTSRYGYSACSDSHGGLGGF